MIRKIVCQLIGVLYDPGIAANVNASFKEGIISE